MNLKPLASLAASRSYVLLVIAALMVGFRDSMAEPYLVLFAVQRAHTSPLALGALLTVRAAGAVLFSMAFGAWVDRRPSLRPLLISLVLGITGYACLATTTDYRLLLLIVAIPLAANNAVFPQLFAIAKRQLDATGGGRAAERGIAIMRAGFSAAWAFGPALGAAVVDAVDYQGTFVASALFGMAALAVLLTSGIRAPARSAAPAVLLAGRAVAAGPPAGLGLGVTAAGFALFSMAIAMGSAAMPLVIAETLRGTTRDVGLAFSTCAFLEVPVMVAVAMRPWLLGGFGGLVAGYLALLVYFVAIYLAPSVEIVIATQAIRAIAIGLVTCIGISYMQDLMPGRAGAAAALYANTGQVGAMLAGVAVGQWVPLFGYRTAFLACAGIAVVGLALINLGARPLRVERAAA